MIVVDAAAEFPEFANEACFTQARYLTPYFSNKSLANFNPNPGPAGTVIRLVEGLRHAGDLHPLRQTPTRSAPTPAS